MVIDRIPFEDVNFHWLRENSRISHVFERELASSHFPALSFLIYGFLDFPKFQTLSVQSFPSCRFLDLSRIALTAHIFKCLQGRISLNASSWCHHIPVCDIAVKSNCWLQIWCDFGAMVWSCVPVAVGKQEQAGSGDNRGKVRIFSPFCFIVLTHGRKIQMVSGKWRSSLFTKHLALNGALRAKKSWTTCQRSICKRRALIWRYV